MRFSLHPQQRPEFRFRSLSIHEILDICEHSLPSLAEAFGRSIVIPSFFSFSDKKLVAFYRSATPRICYRAAIPSELT